MNKKKKPVDPVKKVRKPRRVSTATLVKKLDDIFSKYIRLRDSRPYKYRYFKCISCGQFKEYAQSDCGHFWSRRHMATRFDEDNCNAECRFCCVPTVNVMLSDGSWKKLGDVCVGDELRGVSERSFKEGIAEVLDIDYDRRSVVSVRLQEGEVKCTPEHKWLVVRGSQNIWKQAKDLKPYDRVRRIYFSGTEIRAFDDEVKEVVPLAEPYDIVIMETSLHTFIGDGYVMHNCNRFSADHLNGYAANLRLKIGVKKYDMLEWKHNQSKKWTAFELEALINMYKELVKKMEHERDELK